MKRFVCILFTFLLLLTGCSGEKPDSGQSSVPSSSQNQSSDDGHSEFYVRNTSVDKMLYYFNDVAYGGEFGDDKQKITKWDEPITFMLHGVFTIDDYAKINEFVDFLNSVNGFPGIMEVHDKLQANINIYFYNRTDLVEATSDRVNGEIPDGVATTYYHSDTNIIYEGEIFICTEIEQEYRNSVILEEFYQIFGIIKDTTIRNDSIVYQDGDPIKMSDEDISIFKLLYHPDIKANMTQTETDEIIREIYY